METKGASLFAKTGPSRKESDVSRRRTRQSRRGTVSVTDGRRHFVDEKAPFVACSGAIPFRLFRVTRARGRPRRRSPRRAAVIEGRQAHGHARALLHGPRPRVPIQIRGGVPGVRGVDLDPGRAELVRERNSHGVERGLRRGVREPVESRVLEARVAHLGERAEPAGDVDDAPRRGLLEETQHRLRAASPLRRRRRRPMTNSSGPPARSDGRKAREGYAFIGYVARMRARSSAARAKSCVRSFDPWTSIHSSSGSS
jgi:hypothetical protein